LQFFFGWQFLTTLFNLTNFWYDLCLSFFLWLVIYETTLLRKIGSSNMYSFRFFALQGIVHVLRHLVQNTRTIHFRWIDFYDSSSLFLFKSKKNDETSLLIQIPKIVDTTISYVARVLECYSTTNNPSIQVFQKISKWSMMNY
jgi:hypothetical protein